jgi:hypothetical protein
VAQEALAKRVQVEAAAGEAPDYHEGTTMSQIKWTCAGWIS